MAEAATDLDGTLNAFSAEGALIGRARLAPLLTTSGAAKAAKDARFARGIGRTLQLLRNTAPEGLEALAFAWRATSVTSMREHRRSLIEALSSGAIPAQYEDLPTTLHDPDDRRHVADALKHVREAWKPSYLARAIAAERDGEKARESLCRALLECGLSLGDQIGAVGEALASQLFEQLEPEVGRARRATAILEAFTAAMWASDAEVEPGNSFGSVLSELATYVLLRRRPSDSNVANQFAASLINLVVVVARLHGSLAADASAYAFIGPLYRAFGSAHWPEVVQTQMSRAAAQVLDQLLLLIRLRMPDAELRRVYVAMMGEMSSRRILSADRERGLDPDMAYWLATGKARRTLATQDAIAETAMSAVDADLASAFRDADVIEMALRRTLPDLLSAAEFHSAELAERLEDTVSRVRRLASSVKSAAQNRGFVLKGNPGDVVDFSPVEHEPRPTAVGERTVRLITNGVERSIHGRLAGVVLKADVDKA